MTDFAVIVPTDGRSGSMLAQLLRHAKEDGAKIIVVWTEKIDLLPGWIIEYVDAVVYDREMNIQVWWNKGADIARNRLDLSVAVFVNDDVEVGDGDLAAMADLQGHTLSMIAGNWQSGWCFGLSLRSGLRFDESYTWWYGETDMRERAVELNGIRWVEDTRICHKKFRNTEYVGLREAVQRDIELWESRH